MTNSSEKCTKEGCMQTSRYQVGSNPPLYFCRLHAQEPVDNGAVAKPAPSNGGA